MKNFINILEIISDLEELKKKVYLENPEVFVDLSDKIENRELDEMILFYATKYDYLSIVKFIVENEIIDLNKPSKNTQFKNIKEHILEASNQFNAKDIHDFLSNFDEKNIEKDSFETSIEEGLEGFMKSFGEKLTDLCSQIEDICSEEKTEVNEDTEADTIDIKHTDTIDIEQDDTPNDIKIEEVVESEPKKTETGYNPKFICPNCSCNILEEGYYVLENVGYKFSKEENKIVKVSTEQTKSVTCKKCNYTIEELDPLFLENISTVQNCKNCGEDLTISGITTKIHSEYDKDSNCFVTSKKTYHCEKCNEELSEYQVNYFSL